MKITSPIWEIRQDLFLEEFAILLLGAKKVNFPPLYYCMLKLKLQYFGHLMPTSNSLKKTLMLGKIEGRRRRGDRGWDGWKASSTQWTWVCLSKLWEIVKDRGAWCAAVHGAPKSWTWPRDWTTAANIIVLVMRSTCGSKTSKEEKSGLGQKVKDS